MKEYALQCLKEGPWHRYICRERALNDVDAMGKAAKRWECEPNEVKIIEKRSV